MTAAFELNLTALSLLALVVGMFLIYNTITFSVVQRRGLIGTLRCLGVTRRQIFALVLGEALLVGLIGAAAGLVLGVLLGRGLVGLVTQTINDLYFIVTVRGIALSAGPLIKGLLLGLLATLVAAAVPAFEATFTPPRTVLRRSSYEDRARRIVPLAGAGRAAAAGARRRAAAHAQQEPGAELQRAVRDHDRRGGDHPADHTAADAGGPAGAGRGLWHARAHGRARCGGHAQPHLGGDRRADDRHLGHDRRRPDGRQLPPNRDPVARSDRCAPISMSRRPAFRARAPTRTLPPELMRAAQQRAGRRARAAATAMSRSRASLGRRSWWASRCSRADHAAFQFLGRRPGGDLAGLRAGAGAGLRAAGLPLRAAPRRQRHAADRDAAERAFPIAGVYSDYGSDQGVVMLDLARYQANGTTRRSRRSACMPRPAWMSMRWCSSCAGWSAPIR